MNNKWKSKKNNSFYLKKKISNNTETYNIFT